MENYEILTQIGEGTFGQVYKAKNRLNGEIVAFKVIRKRGRSIKELKSLRQECEIQRHLHHPNIVQMLDSFETDNEIIIVTEYANRELYEILGKAGRLSEHRAQIIACDLVSALYYLHSNRVLHRDLKPQNILLENNGVAKLCDFGFARSMSTGTHVLTSIKGTPLYMAPELIEERPYDHNADLWSLGCIVYELVVGTPPFQTTSILNLVRLIRYKAIKWPAYISETCKSFLQGLLQKDPSQRLSWPALLEHPFVKNKIKIVNTGTVPSPFTAPLSASQARAKQQQLQNLDTRPAYLSKLSDKAAQILEEQARKLEVRRQRTCTSHPRYPLSQAYCHHRINQCQALRHSEPSGTDSSTSVDVLLGNMSLRDSLRSELFYVANGLNRSIDGISESKIPNITTRDTMRKHVETETTDINSPVQQSEATINKEQIEENGLRERGSVKTDTEPHFDRNNSIKVQQRLPDWLPRAIERPIENEEWAVFLQRSMEEIMEGEVGSLLQENCVSVFVSPLRNTSVGSRVLEYVACLLSLPFVVSVSKDTLNKIERVYLDVRVVPNLVYAMKLLLSERERPESERNETDTINAPVRAASTLSADELQALECAMLLLCRLVHNQDQFAAQFCDAIHIVNGIVVLQQLLTLEKRKARVVADLIAILCNLLRSQRENIDLVEAVLLERERMGGDLVDQLVKFVTHRQSVLRSRTCILIRLLARLESRVLEKCWTQVLKSSIEALTDDEDKTIQNLAEKTIAELRQLFHYNQGRNPAEQSS